MIFAYKQQNKLHNVALGIIEELQRFNLFFSNHTRENSKPLILHNRQCYCSHYCCWDQWWWLMEQWMDMLL